MRKSRLFAHDVKGVMPRMSWSPHNLYNLIARSMPFYGGQVSFKKTTMTIYQQRWRSKRLLRGYHGDWIRERTFKRWFLPVDLPRLQNNTKLNIGREASGDERMPVASLFMREVERRLDTLVFRCCFARSAREARSLILQGKVTVNGVKVEMPGTLLNPGDLLSVLPEAIPMLSKELAKKAEMNEAAKMAQAERQREERSGLGEEAAAEGEGEVAEGEQEGKEETLAGESASEDKPASTSEATEPSEGDGQAGIAAEAQGEVAGESAEAEALPTPEKAVKQTSRVRGPKKEKQPLAPGVFPFHLPAYASPFLFIPPYLEVSFTTCSAIYMRHPTITPVKAALSRRPSRGEGPALYKSDVPSPYPAGGEIFSLAWEHYARNAPRTRSDLRRMKLEARVGRLGIQSARAKDEWKKVVAIRRGRDKDHAKPTQFVVGGGAVGKRRTGKASRSGRFLEKGQARGKGADVRA